MFVLTENRRYRWPMTVRLPGPGAGTIVEQSLIVLFEAPHRDVAVAELGAIEKLSPRDQGDALLDNLLSKVKGWEDVVDQDGAAVAFDAAVLRRAAQEPWFRDALDRAYRESLTGEAARLGN